MPAKSVLWPIDSHTVGKHIVLRAYLNAWLPIMGMKQPRILFVDAFAGPGEYTGGEPGSPIIALNALLEHPAKAKITAEVIYLFIEFELKRAEHLESRVQAFRERLPANVKVYVEAGDCRTVLNRVLDSFERSFRHLIPAFVMLDPFGVSHTPMSLVARLLENPKCELYISFMYEAINRFKETDEFELHLDALFGSPDWRRALEFADPDTRKEFVYELYTRRLRESGASHVTRFELFDGDRNRHVYTIFFATKHALGMDRMKAAIWKADRTGGYRFLGRGGNQLSLDIDELNLTPLQRELQQAFGGADSVSIEEISEWARTDATDYHSGQVKRALAPMEKDGRLEIVESPRKQRGKYPDGTVVRFPSSPPESDTQR